MGKLNKYFVGQTKGLTEEDIRDYFSAFGNVVWASMPTGRNGKKKAFAFVTVETPDKSDKRVMLGKQSINGIEVEIKLGLMEGVATTSKKICVRNLGADATADDLRVVFSKYGNVTDTVVKTDESGKCRGFGFVSYDSETAAAAACAKQNVVKGKVVDAVPKVAGKSPKISKEVKRVVKAGGDVEAAKQAKEEERNQNKFSRGQRRQERAKAWRGNAPPPKAGGKRPREGATDAKQGGKPDRAPKKIKTEEK